MQFRARYKTRTETPKDALYACLGLSAQLTQEAANGMDAGTGPGTPDAYGVPTLGTIEPGHLVELDTNGNWILATSPKVTGSGNALPKAIFFVHQGTREEQGSVVGKPVAARGAARFVTPKVNGTSFTVGAPLIAVNGNYQIKVLDDGLQVVGFVGPTGFNDGLLDVLSEAATWG